MKTNFEAVSNENTALFAVDRVARLPDWVSAWSVSMGEYTYTGCGRNNSHILKSNKNQTKQGTQKILLHIKSTYNEVFFKHF